MINDQELQVTLEGNTTFSLELYAQLKRKEGNLFFSPYSISTALAMTYAGARGNTARQMAQVLHFTLDHQQLGRAFTELEAQVNAIQEKSRIHLNVANALWVHNRYHFLQEFLDLVTHYYKAKLSYADFATAYEEARQETNAWVEQQTQGNIKNLIPQGVLSALTRFVLVNAIYFKGNWLNQFDQESTHTASFWSAPDRKVDVLMMGQTRKYHYASISEDRIQLLELPYEGEDLSMIILLPDEKDGLVTLENSLNREKLHTWLGRLRKQEVTVYLPKFKMASQFRLEGTLAKMGMPDVFSNNADFSGMDGTKELFISIVLHKAFIEVNEEGTEAAAATALVMCLGIGDIDPMPVFWADHPFVFLIRENRSGNLLFLGRVIDPSKEGA